MSSRTHCPGLLYQKINVFSSLFVLTFYFIFFYDEGEQFQSTSIYYIMRFNFDKMGLVLTSSRPIWYSFALW